MIELLHILALIELARGSILDRGAKLDITARLFAYFFMRCERFQFQLIPRTHTVALPEFGKPAATLPTWRRQAPELLEGRSRQIRDVRVRLRHVVL